MRKILINFIAAIIDIYQYFSKHSQISISFGKVMEWSNAMTKVDFHGWSKREHAARLIRAVIAKELNWLE